MLVLKIKPCMSKYKQFSLRNCGWLIKSVMVSLKKFSKWITVENLELIHEKIFVRKFLLAEKPSQFPLAFGES